MGRWNELSPRSIKAHTHILHTHKWAGIFNFWIISVSRSLAFRLWICMESRIWYSTMIWQTFVRRSTFNTHSQTINDMPMDSVRDFFIFSVHCAIFFLIFLQRTKQPCLTHSTQPIKWCGFSSMNSSGNIFVFFLFSCFCLCLVCIYVAMSYHIGRINIISRSKRKLHKK